MRLRLIKGLSATVAAGAILAAAATAAPADSPGMFVTGDLSAMPGNSVEFWGAQWWKDNSVSGGSAPAAFKGYAVQVTPSAPGSCSGTFTTDPGNSSFPPAALDSTIDVLVTGNVTKSGPVISGTYTDVIQVLPDPGYAADPGHPGTGIDLGSLCTGGGSPG